MAFPITRMRRLRGNEALRSLVRETELSVRDLILPLFVSEGRGPKREVSSMPGVYQFSIENAVKECQQAKRLGIPGVILFGLPKRKDLRGTEAYAKDGVIPQAVRAIKRAVPDLLVITDVCLCEYISHGHCGMLTKNGEVDNDSTLDLLAKAALAYAQAGADVVAPSDMMDGRVGAIRKALDGAGFVHTPILAYSAKYASAFYGPFREAAESAPRFGDRKGYQMDPANSDEALREVELDLKEGADMVMVKPALAYLDIIRRVKEEFGIPVAAYSVSGEYSLIKAAAQKGWIEEKRLVLEILTSIKRAGADFILTYHAKDAARWLGEKGRYKGEKDSP